MRESLADAHLLRDPRNPVALLGRGEIKTALKVRVHRISEGAKAKIEAEMEEFKDKEIAKFIGELRQNVGDYLLGAHDAKPGEDNVYNGALDNAAGVATMLEAAHEFVASGKAPRRSIRPTSRRGLRARPCSRRRWRPMPPRARWW